MRAARTKSRSRSERTSASTMRAISIQLVTAMMTVIISGLGLDEGGQRQQQEDARKGQEGVDEAHQHGADAAAVVAGEDADDGADDGADQHREEADQQRDAPGMNRRAATSRPSGSVPKI